ncbi:Uncharacterized protein APZ42_011054 [Daphnia magna]|uniref:Uncharacterized protein n=1 Tax=Daphnia magna TaxID=35525 RepID=A0A162T591_9CRUS|nr:Uncharacterized protein APZ42_011054 [Daphnia magna]
MWERVRNLRVFILFWRIIKFRGGRIAVRRMEIIRSLGGGSWIIRGRIGRMWKRIRNMSVFVLFCWIVRLRVGSIAIRWRKIIWCLGGGRWIIQCGIEAWRMWESVRNWRVLMLL